ncbi:PREDICTED: protein AE7 isoform X1 [Theobroma cacao]|uniref:Protein AE7 isoform X1 n=1 Tax=Theobroma cacao TaxID=3641 RepID=A0AB32WUH9_THECC|nr:PREDICTED: protein AE7 isoform X1 [Theobroma cacao]
MVSGLINANPVVYEKKERRLRNLATLPDEYAVEPIDQQEIFDHIRDIKDPEHPYSLEELKVITEDAIEVDHERSYVRVTFTPTVEHCSMATVIGLCLRVKLMRSLPSRYKMDIRVAPGTHATEAAGPNLKHQLLENVKIRTSAKKKKTNEMDELISAESIINVAILLGDNIRDVGRDLGKSIGIETTKSSRVKWGIS